MTDTHHTEDPRIWRLNNAIERLTKTKWTGIGATIHEARKKARPAPNSTRATGYPRATISEGGGTATLTTVEAAADANVFGRATPEQDSLYQLVTEAQALLVECSGVAAELERKTELIRSLLGQAEHDLRACDLCGATDRHPRFGDAGGRLPVSRSLCADPAPGRPACYDVVVRNEGWPTDEQRQHFERTGRWRYRTNGRDQ